MKLLTTIALFFLLTMTARAGSFNVSPIRIELSQFKSTQALILSNESAEPVVIQVQPMLWVQQNGKDIHTATDQIIATPPVIRIPAHGRQVVRVGLRRPLVSDTEGTFRLYLTEIPKPNKAEEVGMQISLRLDLPLFVATKSELRPNLRWSITKDDDGTHQVVVTNVGTAHAQLSDLRFWEDGQVITTPQPANASVLPGASRRWPLVNGRPQPTTLSSWRVRGTADYSPMDTPITFTTERQ